MLENITARLEQLEQDNVELRHRVDLLQKRLHALELPPSPHDADGQDEWCGPEWWG